MKVKLTRDTIVRHKAGEILDVAPEEARRLIAFGNAAEEKETAPKKAKK